MVHNLSIAVKTLIAAVLAAAGQTLVTSSTIDTSGFSGARFIVAMGAITATGTATVQVKGGELADGSDAVALEGATATTDDTGSNKLLIVEIAKPYHRYLTVTVTRATANSVVNNIICELFGASHVPVEADASVKAQTLVLSPEAA